MKLIQILMNLIHYQSLRQTNIKKSMPNYQVKTLIWNFILKGFFKFFPLISKSMKKPISKRNISLMSFSKVHKLKNWSILRQLIKIIVLSKSKQMEIICMKLSKKCKISVVRH